MIFIILLQKFYKNLIECSNWQIDKLIKEKKNDDWLKNYFRKNKIFIIIKLNEKNRNCINILNIPRRKDF